MNAENIIHVENLNKHFGVIHAVKNVSLKVKKGEIFGFLGPNGSGKTTTIRMLCGLLIPDSGQGHCLNYDILTESAQIKKHVGYMTQRFSYYEDLSVYQNLDFIGQIYQIKNRKRKIEETLEKFALKDRRKQLAGTLSGGWKQRLALAASLLHDPLLLLLDEPTAGVDPQARREFWDQIHQLSVQGITTLVSTHYMDEAERCTRLAYIAYGHLLEAGTTQEIIGRAGLTTWAIQGPDLADLMRFFKSRQVEQAVMFGGTLHISGKDAQYLQDLIEQVPDKQKYQFNRIAASLEDVFISLVGRATHEKSAD